MFRRDAPGSLTIWFDNRPVPARETDSVASALLASGIHVTRETQISGTPRGPWCMMGACFDCVAIVGGRRGSRTCMTPAQDGLRVETQR